MLPLIDPPSSSEPTMSSLRDVLLTYVTQVPNMNKVDETTIFDPEDPNALSSKESKVIGTKRSIQSNRNSDSTVRVLAPPPTRKQMNLAVNSTNHEGVVPANKWVYNKIKSNDSPMEAADFWDTKNAKNQINIKNLQRKMKLSNTQQVGLGLLIWGDVVGSFILIHFAAHWFCYGKNNANFNKCSYAIYGAVLFMGVGSIIIIYVMAALKMKQKLTEMLLVTFVCMIICGIICFIIFSVSFCCTCWTNDIDVEHALFTEEILGLKLKLEYTKISIRWMMLALGIEYIVSGIIGLLISLL